MMNLKILEYMVAIDDSKNVTRAAEKLFISQSGLNQQLIKTEMELGTALFYRSKSGLRRTPAGDIYLQAARTILKIAQNAEIRINDLNEHPRGNVSFGLPFEHGTDMFMAIAGEFSMKLPGYSITLMEQTVKSMEQNIKDNKIDMAFIMREEKPAPDFEYVHLCCERLVLGAPINRFMSQYSSHSGRGLSAIDLSFFRHEKFALMFAGSTMRNVIDKLFERAGYKPNIQYETFVNNTLYRLVSGGLCCTILPQSYARKDQSTAWFLLEDDPKWNWYIIYSRTRYLSLGDKLLIQLAKNYAKRLENYWQINEIGMPQPAFSTIK